ncbi:MAG: hypothetical protein IKN60_06915, partial [Bacteroidales bacterium]|nr:hypothetical protein [Bacteroidales bacterium]
GTNVFLAGSGAYASLRLAPVFYLPCDWQIGMQVIYYTKHAPARAAYGAPVYGCLSLNKQFGRNWNLGVDWHDMAGSRHAVQLRLQYRFSNK